MKFLLAHFRSPTFNGVLAVVLISGLAFGPMLKADTSNADQAASGTLISKSSDSANPDLRVQIETKSIDADGLESEITNDLKTTSSDNSEIVVVSSDETDALSLAARESNRRPRDSVFLLPFGKAIQSSADAVGGINDLLKKSGLYFVNTFKQDKVGVSIATFTLANEVIRWIHVSNASNFVISSNIVYSIVWSAIFLNKDTWSKTTKPIQKPSASFFISPK